MRHKFTAEETVRGFKRAAQVRGAKLRLEKKALKERSKEWFWDQVGKLTDANKVPYLAAFTFGALCAAQSHGEIKDAEGHILQEGLPAEQLALESFRQGIEAIIFLECCKVTSPGMSASTSQAFGTIGLTAIGAQVPLSVFSTQIEAILYQLSRDVSGELINTKIGQPPPFHGQPAQGK